MRGESEREVEMNKFALLLSLPYDHILPNLDLFAIISFSPPSSPTTTTMIDDE